jgi:peptide/nickel transport system ATP-binding protein
MYLGHIVEIADRDTLFSAPRHPYTEILLSAVPVPNPRTPPQRVLLQGDPPSPANPPSGCRFHTRCPLAQDICRREKPELTARGGAPSPTLPRWGREQDRSDSLPPPSGEGRGGGATASEHLVACHFR